MQRFDLKHIPCLCRPVGELWGENTCAGSWCSRDAPLASTGDRVGGLCNSLQVLGSGAIHAQTSASLKRAWDGA